MTWGYAYGGSGDDLPRAGPGYGEAGNDTLTADAYGTLCAGAGDDRFHLGSD